MIKKLQFNCLTLLFVFGLFSFTTNLNGQCEAGVLASTGMVTVPDGMTFDLDMSGETIPAGQNWGWSIDNTHTNGTGGIQQRVAIGPIMSGMVTWDNDLSGILSSNGLPKFEGTWVFKGIVYASGADPFGTLCSETVDSLIVEFGPLVAVSCEAGTMTTIGPQTVCFGESFDVNSTDSDVPATGGFGWFFDNAVTGGTGGTNNQLPFILTNSPTMESYDNTLNGVLPLDLEGTWVVKAATYELATNAFGSICSFSEDSLILTFNPELQGNIENLFNLEVTANVVGGEPPYSYAWSNGETSKTASDLMDGTMTVTITDANDCTAELSIDLMNTSVNDINGLVNYSLSPNPTDGIVNVSMNFAKEKSLKISMVSIQGKIIETVANERSTGGNYTLDLTGYSPGIYLMQVVTDSGQFAERIFVK